MARLGMKQGMAAGSAARKAFSANRAAGGTFAAIGGIGRRSGSTLTPQQLARSGKMRSAMVAGGIAGMGAMNKRRGSGVSRTSGRPTGMYGY